ncbi:Bax inhibitor-1/YccA family protein [Ligilactobacillus hohenheimensis]|uniref:Bax inhibitor-1/YccA family protein n=1 Tax=Ligilactobacillus hohenheimensis TaxID=2991832 RepID=UPI0024B89C3D|nr:Bax inhibitor-1/YccA family protein [Ligilactobacillus hohenheimensis]
MNGYSVENQQQGLNKFLSKVYWYMAGAVLVSAITALGTVVLFGNMVDELLGQHPVVYFILLAVQLVMVAKMSFSKSRSSAMSNFMLFGFAALEGIIFSSILLEFTAADITLAFVAAAVDFAVLALYGTRTKKDLSSWGRQALAALIAILIVSVVNIFLQSSLVEFVISIAGVLIFSVLSMWDAHRIKQIYLQMGEAANTTPIVVSAALQLYLDFINLFLELLEIFGSSDRN